ncbi:MAG: periplasmic heavy metal sensor [Thermoanaerobaculia bacterium]|nr:periplasmic heavy metal sensor [Thermoanaerobaculia bacterium]
MKSTTTRRLTTAAVALGLLLAGGAAFAGQSPRGGRDGAPGRGLRAALATLDLTSEQNEKLKVLFAAERARLEPLRQEGRALREALRASAEAPDADPAAVGAAFLKARAHRTTMRQERETSREKLEAILTPEQRARLEGWRDAHREMRRGALAPGGRGHGRPGPPPPID